MRLVGARTIVGAIKHPGAANFVAFGSRSVGARQKIHLDIQWIASSTGGAGSGNWVVNLGVNGASPTSLGSVSVTTDANVDASRNMEFAIKGAGVMYTLIDEIILTPVGGNGGDNTATLTNGSFESTGSAVYGPLLSADNWTFSGATSTIGAMPSPTALGFPAATDGAKALYVGVDYVAGASTVGKAYQDIGQSTIGTIYTINAQANASASAAAGYKLSLRDAVTDLELVSTTNTGAVSISYTETVTRNLRLQVETNGTVTSGTALRTSVDNITFDAELIDPEPTDPGPVNPAAANQVCYFENVDWSGL